LFDASVATKVEDTEREREREREREAYQALDLDEGARSRKIVINTFVAV
jgi:hypothetical protein